MQTATPAALRRPSRGAERVAQHTRAPAPSRARQERGRPRFGSGGVLARAGGEEEGAVAWLAPREQEEEERAAVGALGTPAVTQVGGEAAAACRAPRLGGDAAQDDGLLGVPKPSLRDENELLVAAGL